MFIKHQLDKILVSLEVDSHDALLVVLSKNGDLVRRGNGSPGSKLPLLQGFSAQSHFDALMMTISEDTFNYVGLYEQQPMLGRTCKLMIVCNGPGDAEAGFKVLYGEDSHGPPKELVEIVINAVKITDPWYTEEQQKLLEVSPSLNEKQMLKKWWEVWK